MASCSILVASSGMRRFAIRFIVDSATNWMLLMPPRK
jgi:hypothetical protein